MNKYERTEKNPKGSKVFQDQKTPQQNELHNMGQKFHKIERTTCNQMYDSRIYFFYCPER